MKSFFIFLSRNKAYTLINVLGLSLSMMFVILIGTYTWQEYHVNAQYPKAGRILVYGLNMSPEHYTGGHWRLQKYFKSRYPEIESSCAIYGGQDHLSFNYTDPSGHSESYATLMVDSTFFDLLDIPMLVGNAHTALADRDCAVVTDGFARRVFGSPEKAIGQRLTVDGTDRSFHITGVVSQFSHSSIPKASIILRFENCDFVNPALIDEKLSNAVGAEILFLERPGAHLETKTADMNNYQKQFFWVFQYGDIKISTTLTPLSKVYFQPFNQTACFVQGNQKTVFMLLAVGLVILLFAVFNYINLTNAISEKRMREMAMRRLVGASRGEVVSRLIKESIVLCAFSMLLALLLAWAFKPYTEQLLGTELTLLPQGTAGVVRLVLVVVFTIVLGIVAGLMPAAVVSQAKPIDIVRGTTRLKPHGSSLRPQISSLFIIIQSTATIVLIAMSMAMSAQIHHMVTLYRGYNTKNVISLGMRDDNRRNMDAWYDGLRQLPQVVAATACAGTPYDGGYNETFIYQGHSISAQKLCGDSQYLKVFGLKVSHLTGLKNNMGHEVYVNRQLLAEESLPMNSRYYYQGNAEGSSTTKENISGVLADFTIRTLDTEQHPIVLTIMPDSLRYMQTATNILVQGDPVTAFESVRQLFKRIFKQDIDSNQPVFIDQQIALDYQSETRMVTMLRIFSLIAVVISVLGLVAMSTYYIDGRRREIAVRKVFGSTSGEVSRRFIRRFLSYTLIAFVIATPLTIYLYGSWVAQYSHRAVWWPWIPVAGAIVLVVSYAAVAVQSHQAARQNPAENLKQE